MSEPAPEIKALEDKSTKATGGSKSPAPSSSSRSSILPLLSFVLLAGGLAALAWRQEILTQAQQQRAAALEAQLASLQRNDGTADELAPIRQAQDELSGTLERSLQVLREELSAANARVASQAAQLDTLNRELAATNERVRASTADSDREWMRVEAQSLLRLAVERLELARDVDAAIALYASAERLLTQMDEPALASAREALAREMSSLQSLPRVDRNELYARLGTQSARLEQFAATPSSTAVSDFDVEAVPATTDETSEGWFSAFTTSLREYFVVTRRDQAVTPLLTAEEEYLIRRGIRLKLEEARLALLQGDQEIYRMALDEAIAAVSVELQSRDPGDDASKQALIVDLTALRDTVIAVELPPLGQALDLLQQTEGAGLAGAAGTAL